MDSIRRQLMLSVPAVTLVGLTGCGGADGSADSRATAQAVGNGSAQAQTTASGDGITIRHRGSSNFPLIGGSFDLLPSLDQIQSVINQGALGGKGPVLALQLSTTRQLNGDTLIVALNLSVKLKALTDSPSTYVLGPGGTQAGDSLLTCRRLGVDGSLTTFAHRITDGVLTVARLPDDHIRLTLRDVVAIPAPGFNNQAQGSLSLMTGSAITLRTITESSGDALT